MIKFEFDDAITSLLPRTALLLIAYNKKIRLYERLDTYFRIGPCVPCTVRVVRRHAKFVYNTILGTVLSRSNGKITL